MSGIIASGDLPYVAGYLIVMTSAAIVTTLATGYASKWRLPRTTALMGGALFPAGILGLAGYILFLTPDGPPPNDVKGMAAVALFVMAAVTYPFTSIASFLVARRATRYRNDS
jgi:ABC-type transport system involved in cytochrome c biogenesis permease subunit